MRLALLRITSSALLACALLATPAMGGGVSAAARPRPERAAAAWIVLVRPATASALTRAPEVTTARGRAAFVTRAQATDTLIDALEERVGFQATFRYRYALQGFSARLFPGQVAALRADPTVVAVTRDRPVSVEGTLQPVTADVLRVHGEPSGPGPAGDVDMNVAVIDTGIGPVGGNELNIQAPQPGMNCANDGHASDWIKDGYGHGTHVAGTIGARDNGIGVVGVAPGAKLWAVRVFDALGRGSDSTVVCGIEWVTAWRVANPSLPMVANMSLRGPTTGRDKPGCGTGLGAPGDTDAEHLAICGGTAAGAIFVVAAGNESDDVTHWIPSRYPQVITVSSVTDFDGLPGSLSSTSHVPGCVPPAGRETDDTFARYSNFGAQVDIAAPGTCVRSTAPNRDSGDMTRLMSGTSMATPHVTGAVARYLALPGHATTTPDAMRDLVVASGSLDWDARTDPDGTPDRLLDVTALLAGSSGLAVWPTPALVGVPAGIASRTLGIEIQRIGGFAGSVAVSASGLPAGVVASSPGLVSGITGTHLDLTLDGLDTVAEGNQPASIDAQGSGDGDPSGSASITLRVDRSAPLVGDPWPSAVLRAGESFDGTASMRLAWGTSDPGGAVARTEVQRAIGTGEFVRIASTTLGSRLDTTIAPLKSYRYRLRAIDHVENATVSSILPTRLTVVGSDSAAIVWNGSWRTRVRRGAEGGSLRTSASRGASAQLDFSGRSVAWVGQLGPGRGVAVVRIDGTPVATIHLRASSDRPRRVVFASGQLTAGTHRLTITVRRGLVDVDAILILD